MLLLFTKHYLNRLIFTFPSVQLNKWSDQCFLPVWVKLFYKWCVHCPSVQTSSSASGWLIRWLTRLLLIDQWVSEASPSESESVMMSSGYKTLIIMNSSVNDLWPRISVCLSGQRSVRLTRISGFLHWWVWVKSDIIIWHNII